MTARLAAADEKRLNTWILLIVETFLHSPAYSDQGDERCYAGTGFGLQINRISGAWYSRALPGGGWSAFELLSRVLCPGGEAEAYEYAVAWLASHPGEGDQRGADDPDADAAHATRKLIHKTHAIEVLAQMEPVAGTRVEDYRVSRKLTLPSLDNVIGIFRNSRPGEDALVVRLVDHGRTTGVQETHIDALASKAAHEPVRQRYDLEPAPGAYMPIKPAGPARDGLADIVFGEGFENAESVRQLGDRPWEIRGLPGIGALRHQTVARGTRVLICADGDAPGSPAAKELAAGIDHLINDCGAEVLLAKASLGQDANSILREHTSTAPLLTLLAGADKAKLSAAGEAERLSRLELLEAAAEVSDVAQRLGIPVGDLRRDIARRRRRREQAAGATARIEAEVAAAAVLPKDPIWTDPLPTLGEASSSTTACDRSSAFYGCPLKPNTTLSCSGVGTPTMSITPRSDCRSARAWGCARKPKIAARPRHLMFARVCRRRRSRPRRSPPR